MFDKSKPERRGEFLISPYENKIIDVIAKDHNVSVARFNPLVPKGSANKYHLILSKIVQLRLLSRRFSSEDELQKVLQLILADYFIDYI